MKSLLLGMASLLIASPAMAHPKHHRTSWEYSYPRENVMVRRDYKNCKKITYTTKYDKYGWYTERDVSRLKSCSKHKHHHHHHQPKVKVIIK